MLSDVFSDVMCCVLLGVCWGRQCSALQHADTMVYGTLTLNGMRRGQKSYVLRGGEV